jgi:hypothetical protein
MLGLAAVLAAGFLFAGIAPVSADPPRHAKAHGYKDKNKKAKAHKHTRACREDHYASYGSRYDNDYRWEQEQRRRNEERRRWEEEQRRRDRYDDRYYDDGYYDDRSRGTDLGGLADIFLGGGGGDIGGLLGGGRSGGLGDLLGGGRSGGLGGLLGGLKVRK